MSRTLRDDAWDFPLGKLRDLARLTPDPDFLGCVADAIARGAAALAAERRAAGEISVRIAQPSLPGVPAPAPRRRR